jgi:hypothetical protein
MSPRTTKSLGRLTLLGFATLAAVGCNSNNDPKLEAGKLGVATFAYLCTDQSTNDAYCDVYANQQAFPKIALGSTFFVGAISADSSKNDRFEISSVSPKRMTTSDAPSASYTCTDTSLTSNACTYQPSKVTALAQGVTSLLAKSTSGGVDTIDVYVVPALDLRLTQVTLGGDGRVTGTLGPISGTVSLTGVGTGDFTMRAAPASVMEPPDQSSELGGALAAGYQWTSSNTATVGIIGSTTKNVVELRPLASGSSTITVTSGSLSRVVMVTVP